ncbi:MAG: DNA repair protein RadA [Bacteriovoracaceae bacterium]|nr:DNA repair protein RadA [Bacteriovoracaceae bacterium]
MVKKNSIIYVCQKCSYQAYQWIGKCPQCEEWNSFEEENQAKSIADITSGGEDGILEETPKLLGEIEKSTYTTIQTGVREFDRVIGGGLVQGSLILIGGEPGIGKSTLLTDIVGKLAQQLTNENVLYVSGEESANQIADRFRRLNIDRDNYYIYHERSWQKILKQINKYKPRFLVLDSIQTTTSSEIPSAPGTISQVKEVTYELMNHAKAKNITCFIIGHITKEGSLAGPKVLEHMVDTVIYFEGDQFGHYRLLRVIKNRFGNTNEVGIFEMCDNGLQEVLNPSQYFLTDKLEGAFGRSLTCILEGSRSLFIEIQALVVENKFGNGRRTTQGLDSNRLSMLVAIIEKYFEIPLGFNDIYLNVVGGIKLVTRESDLSIIASLISSYREKPLDEATIFLGEVGLTGEVRSVPQVELRLKEMSQLNYKRVITSLKTAQMHNDKYPLEIIGIKRASEIDEYL